MTLNFLDARFNVPTTPVGAERIKCLQCTQPYLILLPPLITRYSNHLPHFIDSSTIHWQGNVEKAVTIAHSTSIIVSQKSKYT